jgi:hypothetical protein
VPSLRARSAVTTRITWFSHNADALSSSTGIVLVLMERCSCGCTFSVIRSELR